MKSFETVIMEIHFAFDTHSYRVFLANFASISLLCWKLIMLITWSYRILTGTWETETQLIRRLLTPF